MRNRAQHGQSTVELALCLPFVAALIAVIVQVGIVSVTNGRVWHAAREAVRVAAVDGDRASIKAAAETSGVAPIDVTTDPVLTDRAQGAPVTVTVRHAPAARIPVIGRLFDGITLEARATMRIETP